MRKLLVTIDGSCMRKRMGVGVIVRDENTQEILHEESQHVGWGTSCRAEWFALNAACEIILKKFPGESVVIYTDSQLVYRQLSGEYRVRDKNLKPLYRKAVEQLKKLKARVRWHRRDEGDGPLADELANKGGRHGSYHRMPLDKKRHRRNAPRKDARRGTQNHPTTKETERRP